MMESYLNRQINHKLYGVMPTHGFFQQHPTTNDVWAHFCSSGLLKIVVGFEHLYKNKKFVK
jgi:hypothetical protein